MYLLMVRKLVGIALCVEGVAMVPAALVALADQDEGDFQALLWSGLFCLAVGLLLNRAKLDGRKMQQRDGFAAVALCWIALTLFGALPYVFGGVAPTLADAVFESASGFSTTGASVFGDVEAMPRGIQFWRAQTQWMGGMGVLVLMLALLPKLGEGSVNLMRAESPGPIKSKLLPKARETAKLLYKIYIGLTVAQIIALLCLGLPLFDSVTLAFATISTGGFTITNASIASYASPAVEWVLIVFMFLAGINFSVLYLALRREWKSVLRNEELRVYAIIVLAFTVLMSADLLMRARTPMIETLRPVLFQVVSLLTTTGFITADYDLWPGFCQVILLLLMCLGANAGSTSGGLKTSRLIMLVKNCRLELSHIVNPREVNAVHIDGVRVTERGMSSISQYFFIYMLTLISIALVLSWDDLSALAVLGAAMSSIGNVGPAFLELGPTDNYAALTALSKYTMSLGMLMGRLELLPMLVILFPNLWRKY